MLTAALMFKGLIEWSTGTPYDIVVWPIYLALAGIVVGGIVVVILAIWGIRKLLKHRENRLKND